MVLAVAARPFGIATRERALGAALQQTTINIFFAGVLLLFLLLGTSNRLKYVNSSIFQFFGYISYGLYLSHLLAFRQYDRIVRAHWPQLLPTSYHFELVVLKFAVAGGFAVGAAYLSRRFFEARFLLLKNRMTWSRSTTEEFFPIRDVAAA